MRTSRAPGRVPDFTMWAWRRLLLACPIPHRGCMPHGDFLMCGEIAQTQWCNAASCTGLYFIGLYPFVYVKRHDMLVRADFVRWVRRHWREVLLDGGARKARG